MAHGARRMIEIASDVAEAGDGSVAAGTHIVPPVIQPTPGLADNRLQPVDHAGAAHNLACA
jgi:hypothetical protein